MLKLHGFFHDSGYLNANPDYCVQKGHCAIKVQFHFLQKFLSGVNFNHALMQVEIHQHLSTMYFTVNNFWGGGGGIRVAVVGD